MTSDLTSELKKAATSAFEQLGFLLPDQDLSEEQEGAPVAASCRIHFRGPYSGAMEVVAAGAYLDELAGNMLGDGEAPSRDLVMDALGEIGNVICGNVLPALGGKNAVFDLQAPEVHPGTLPAAPGMEEVARVRLGVDEGRAELTVHLSR